MTIKDQPQIGLVYTEELSQYQLSPQHPLQPIRLKHMHELMKTTGLMDLTNIASIHPRFANRQEIGSAHDPDYVNHVNAVSNGCIVPNSSKHGLGTSDNPIWKGMFENIALSVGSTLTATELVISGKADIGFAPAGGVHHHAMRSYASGFGVFNDAVIAINAMITAGLRIAYVDIDCHHGDGVQAGYYDSDQVLTISIHESGQWLFPGTGNVQEIGQNDGLGYSANIPLAPYTQDPDWHAAFDELIAPLIKAFKPDVLFTQLGIDTHFQDPLTHMLLTTQGFNLAIKKLAQLASDIGKWVAVGGGGYDFSAVARSWTMALATMADFNLPQQVPTTFSSLKGLTKFDDQTPPQNDSPYLNEIHQFNSKTIEEVRALLFPKFSI